MRLVELTHSKIKLVLESGDSCIDATAGNGHDSLFLAQQIAPQGIVYSFDIQETALEQTRKRLKKANLIGQIRLIQATHAEVSKFVDQEDQGRIKVGMFNLGYLPGGNHDIVTTPSSTISAILKIYAMLKPSGIITVLCYRGHSGGLEETKEVINLCRQKKWDYEKIDGNSKPNSPVLICIQKV